MDPAPFLRGVAFPGTAKVAYPRAKPEDAIRLPLDTWYQAQIPAGVRLELVGDAEVLDITYQTANGEPGPRGPGGGTTFAAWRGSVKVAEERAELGDGTVHLPLGDRSADERTVIHLPEVMRPRVLGLTAAGGTVEPPPPQPRWVVYGDSVAEGWMASEPALAWPALVGRDRGLDVTNLGYAGAARGEIVSAEHVAALPADVIAITHGTNCWTRIPHSAGMVREGLLAFLVVVRQGHPDAAVLVASPVVRPDAESTPNRLGATLADLRAVIEAVVTERIAAGDGNLVLVPGRDLIREDQLADGLHPNDDGHRAIAAALGPRIAATLGARTG